jgi:hypothetical protein
VGHQPSADNRRVDQAVGALGNDLANASSMAKRNDPPARRVAVGAEDERVAAGLDEVPRVAEFEPHLQLRRRERGHVGCLMVWCIGRVF